MMTRRIAGFISLTAIAACGADDDGAKGIADSTALALFDLSLIHI